MLIPVDALDFEARRHDCDNRTAAEQRLVRTFGHLQGLVVDVSVTRSSSGGVPVVAVSGEVDVYSAPALKESLTGLLQSGDSSVVVDLTDVAFLDSTGLGALVEARAATSEAGGVLPLVCKQERILKLFTITGLDGVFAIHSTLEDAVQAAAV